MRIAPFLINDNHEGNGVSDDISGDGDDDDHHTSLPSPQTRKTKVIKQAVAGE
jgi:hypothetical protein